MAAALTPVFGGAGFVYHTGPGVRFGGKADVTPNEERPPDQRRPYLPRESNFWEVENIEATLAGFRAIRTVLPADLANWRRANIDPAKFPNTPFEFDPLLAAQEDGRLLRAFSASSGDRFISMPIRITDRVPFIARRPMTVDVIDPMTATVLRTANLDAGQDLGIDGSQQALILKGTWR